MDKTFVAVTLYQLALMVSLVAALIIAFVVHAESGRVSAMLLSGGGTFVALMTLATAALSLVR